MIPLLALALVIAGPPANQPCGAAPAGVAIDLVGTHFAPEQGADPTQPVAAIDARQSMLLFADGRFLLRTSTLYPGGIEFRFRTLGSIKGEDTVDEIGWRDGDVLQHDDAASAVRDIADLRMLAPTLLSCNSGGTGQFSDVAGRAVVLKRNAAGDIVRADQGSESYAYDGWHDSALGRAPTLIVRTRDGREVARWSDIRARAATVRDSALLTLPGGYRPADAPGPLRATSLGNGAYRVDGTTSGYHTGFVVGSGGVALFDAPVSVDEAKAVRAVIESVAPGRRIAYVVVSHVHGDHVAGLPAYPEAVVVTGDGGSAALRRQFGERTPAEVREITALLDIDLGNRIVHVNPIASSHSETMLVAFDRATGTLFQGDMFYIPERGAVPIAFETGRELIALIDRQNYAVGTIVGVHGRSGTMVELRGAVGRMPTHNFRGCVGYWLTKPEECRR